MLYTFLDSPDTFGQPYRNVLKFEDSPQRQKF